MNVKLQFMPQKSREFSPCLFFSEHQQLAADIIKDHNNDAGNELHNKTMPMQPIHRYCQKQLFKTKGSEPTPNKFYQLWE